MRLAVSGIYQAESEFLVEEVTSLDTRVSAKGPIFIFVDEIHCFVAVIRISDTVMSR